MPRRSNRFQRLYFQIQTSLSEGAAKVEESAEVWNDASDRNDEIDVLITFNHSGHKFVVGVQCRDHSRPAGADWIRDLKQQREDCRLDKMIAVHSKGFTKSAVKAAKKHNIEILLLSAAERSDWTRFRPTRLRVKIPPRVTRAELLPKFELPPDFRGSALRDTVVGCKAHHCGIGTPRELIMRVIRSKNFQREVRQMAERHAGWATMRVDWPFPNHYLCVNGQHFDFNLMRLHVECAMSDVPIVWNSFHMKGPQEKTVDELVATIGDREVRIMFPDQHRSKKISIDFRNKPNVQQLNDASGFELSDL